MNNLAIFGRITENTRKKPQKTTTVAINNYDFQLQSRNFQCSCTMNQKYHCETIAVLFEFNCNYFIAEVITIFVANE